MGSQLVNKDSCQNTPQRLTDGIIELVYEEKKEFNTLGYLVISEGEKV